MIKSNWIGFKRKYYLAKINRSNYWNKSWGTQPRDNENRIQGRRSSRCSKINMESTWRSCFLAAISRRSRPSLAVCRTKTKNCYKMKSGNSISIRIWINKTNRKIMYSCNLESSRSSMTLRPINISRWSKRSPTPICNMRMCKDQTGSNTCNSWSPSKNTTTLKRWRAIDI